MPFSTALNISHVCWTKSNLAWSWLTLALSGALSWHILTVSWPHLGLILAHLGLPRKPELLQFQDAQISLVGILQCCFAWILSWLAPSRHISALPGPILVLSCPPPSGLDLGLAWPSPGGFIQTWYLEILLCIRAILAHLGLMWAQSWLSLALAPRLLPNMKGLNLNIHKQPLGYLETLLFLANLGLIWA